MLRQTKFLAASTYVDAGDLPKAQKLAATLSAEATSEPQAYGKIIEGMMALKRKEAKEAIKQITAANTCWTPGSGASNWGAHTWKRACSRRPIRSLINVRSGEGKPSNCLWITCRLTPIFRPCITTRDACGKE
jgi:hypothetical protein